MIGRAWQCLVAGVAAREDATSLALCRMVMGLTVVAHVGRFWLSGTAALALVHPDHGGLGTQHGWLTPVGGATLDNVHALCAVIVLSALLVTVGFVTRPALVVLWLSYRAMSMLNVDARGAYDGLLIDTMFILLLSGSANALSLDARVFSSVRAQANMATRWPRMLLVFQLGLMYSASAIMKASSGWVPGGDATALWYILHQVMWTRTYTDWLPLWTVPLTQVATTMVWCWELGGLAFVAAVFLGETKVTLSPRLAQLKRLLARIRFQTLYLVFGLGMHVGIEVFMEVGAFTFASLALYVCAVHPDSWRAMMQRLTSWVSRSAAPS